MESAAFPNGKAGPNSSPHANTGNEITPKWDSQLAVKFVSLVKLYFCGEKKKRAFFLAGITVAFCFTTTGLLVVLSYTQRDIGTALQKKDADGYYAGIRNFFGLIIFACPFLAYNDYFKDVLAVEWRTWMTNFLLTRYYADHAYFKLKMDQNVDNPDQRMTDDVESFIFTVVTLVSMCLTKMMNAVAFISILWSIAPELVVFLILYAALGTGITTMVFGPVLTKINYAVLQRSADFRFSLMRSRENAESIAFFRGEAHELHATQHRLQRALVKIWESIKWRYRLEVFSNCFHFTTSVLPGLVVAPRYFAGEVEFGVISQAGFAFATIMSAMNIIVDNINTLSSLSAQITRLHDFLDHAALSPAGSRARAGAAVQRFEVESPAAALELRGLALHYPHSQDPLFDPVSLQVAPGERLLIVGPSGCGKSTLLRAIAGLWDWGAGTIHAPPSSTSSFIPQSTYMPLGTLRKGLLFGSKHYHQNGTGLVSDASLMQALREVNLGELPGRVGGLDTEVAWADILSIGEQQRIAFARALLNSATFVFLDEASSALDVSTEAILYEALGARTPTYVSVGHRFSLLKFHTHVLSATFQQRGEGKDSTTVLKWVHQTVAEYKKTAAAGTSSPYDTSQ